MKRHETSIKLANNATNFEGLRESGHSFTRIFEFFAPSELQQEIYSPLIFVILDDPAGSTIYIDLLHLFVRPVAKLTPKFVNQGFVAGGL